jgi:tRNA dimethylallyltransferase
MNKIAVLLMGPTGAGKSDLALRLADGLPLDIVSVDSAMIYKGMDIGTAKPATEVLARVPHRLIDVLDPAQSYSAGEFVRDALIAMNDIWSRGRHPLLVGGTMLYFHALTQGIADLPQSDPAIRAEIEARAAAHGWSGLHAELERVDPEAAARIHVNDPQRIQRALEVFRITGQPITRLQQFRTPRLSGVDVIEYALAPVERARLHAGIERRFELMMQAGFLAEVSRLYERGDLSLAHPSIRCVGYRQLWQHLAGECSLQAATVKGIAATRQLAKRQWTWLRRRALVKWVDPANPDLTDDVISALSVRIANS